MESHVVLDAVHFAILSFRGGALYNYYHHYADKAAMFDWVQKLGLVAPRGRAGFGGVLETLGLIVHGDTSTWRTQTSPTFSTASSTCWALA